MDWFSGLNPIVQVLVATLFTWVLTAVGSGLVFAFRTVERRALDAMTGFAAGVMIAASLWSLLEPSFALAELRGGSLWFPPVAGFLAGAAFLMAIDRVLPHLRMGHPAEEAEGIGTTWKRSVLIVLGVALRNIPQGLAVGVAFAAAAAGTTAATVGGAIALVLGIGLQNIPEGTSVSVPLRREGVRARKAFWYGHLPGVVEPVAGLLGAVTVIAVPRVLPYAPAFAAGAMLFVVVEELLPESRRGSKTDGVTVFALIGFALMMTLDAVIG